jgi:hypothetical protein
MSKKNERNLAITRATLIDGRSYTALANEHGITRQRVKQIVDAYGGRYDDSRVDTFRIVFDFEEKDHLHMFVKTLALAGIFGGDFWIRRANKSELVHKGYIRTYVTENGPVKHDTREYDVFIPLTLAEMRGPDVE